ncbi:MAG: ImpA family type VI secretion system protein [Achromobacter sp.]|uniref:type VI secretion system protein TssA n=1 Tax=Achromobacter sp. TaxID=134375 RepID=UPI003CFDE102
MPTSSHLETSPEAVLLQPLDEASPCGPDLEYDPDYVVLLANVATRADAQYGDFVDSAAPVNWAEAERDCRALLARSKDVRLLVILARCRARQEGAAGLRTSLELIDAMLRRFGKALNPVPLIDGEPDPLITANALSALADPDGLVADVRDIALPKSLASSLQLRDIERALAKTRLKDALAPETANRLVADLLDRRETTALALAAAAAALERIESWASETLGGVAPELAPLARLLEPFRGAAHADHAPVPAEAPLAAAEAPAGAALAPTIATASPADTRRATSGTAPAPTRWDVLEQLRAARTWFEANEPSSPVSVLLKQAERMIGRRYSELHRMVPPDLLEQWDCSPE